MAEYLDGTAKNVIGFYIHEKRYCTVCGKTQIKLQEV